MRSAPPPGGQQIARHVRRFHPGVLHPGDAGRRERAPGQVERLGLVLDGDRRQQVEHQPGGARLAQRAHRRAEFVAHDLAAHRLRRRRGESGPA
ncbi:hypothetical protein [Streptomyces sp. 8K308]|uniref:hypothetical protein n=1 Tax=Streptomyces sp. 8K308 TaxID=2530388 RepID=UPI003262E7CD